MEVGGNEAEQIPVRVPHAILEKLVTYCEHHKNEEPRDAHNHPSGPVFRLPGDQSFSEGPVEEMEVKDYSIDEDWDRRFVGGNCIEILQLADVSWLIKLRLIVETAGKSKGPKQNCRHVVTVLSYEKFPLRQVFTFCD